MISYIKLGSAFTITQSIPVSTSGDTVTIKIVRVSDGYTWNFSMLAFENADNSGSMTWVSNSIWKSSFTPPTQDTYQVVITDSTLDVEYSQTLIAENQDTAINITEEAAGTSASDQLTAVENAIIARLNGGAVQSYSAMGRNLQYVPLSELYKIRALLRQEVAAGSGRTTSFVQFNDPV